MYRLLIVDDEKDILEWLEELFIDRTILEEELEVYTAQSGSKALALLDKIRFDVVLSDIKMPGINGIELFKRIKTNWTRCRVVFLTGYRNFDYVYEVIQSQGVRYILKTESDEAIVQNVESALRDIEEELNNKEVINQAKEQLEKYNLVIQKDYFNQLLEEEVELKDINKGSEDLKLPLSIDLPVLMVVGRFDNLKENISCMERYEIYEKVKVIMEENISSGFNMIQHVYDTYYGIWLFQSPKQGEVEWRKLVDNLMGNIEYVHKASHKKLGLTISFAMSEEKIGIDQLGSYYRYLKQQLIQYMQQDEQECLIKVSHREDKLEQIERADWHEVSNKLLNKVHVLEKYIELRKKEAYYQLLGEVFEHFEGVKNKYYGITLEVYYNVAMMLLRFIHTNKLNTQIAFQLGIYKLTRIDEHKDWHAAVEYLYEVSQAIFESLGDNEKDKSKETIDQVMEYINNHLGEDLGLVRLADYVHFNPSYLSRLFRQISGHKLSDYITKERIKKAKLLIEEDRYKINEIAQKVGYESAHSFTRTFKGLEGMSPVEYKSLYFRK